MSMSDNEKVLLEAVTGMLEDEAQLGLSMHDYSEEDSHTFTYNHEEAEQKFKLNTADLVHHQPVCTAFHKVHSYKYLSDTGFDKSFVKNMTAMGVPSEEIDVALAVKQELKEEMYNVEGENKHEKNAEASTGFNPNLGEIVADTGESMEAE